VGDITADPARKTTAGGGAGAACNADPGWSIPIPRALGVRWLATACSSQLAGAWASSSVGDAEIVLYFGKPTFASKLAGLGGSKLPHSMAAGRRLSRSAVARHRLLKPACWREGVKQRRRC